MQKFKFLIFILGLALFSFNTAFALTSKHKKKPLHHHSHHSHHSHHHVKKGKKIKKPKPNYMQGLASFYGDGDGFNGQVMADGQVFNAKNIHEAAHPTLPLGTKLKVTNLANGRTIYVEVTDRMPRKYGRVIDLSSAAARCLGMHKRGIAPVKLEKVSNAEFEENKHYLEVNDGDNGNPD